MLDNGRNYLSMLGLKLNHVSKRGHWYAKVNMAPLTSILIQCWPLVKNISCFGHKLGKFVRLIYFRRTAKCQLPWKNDQDCRWVHCSHQRHFVYYLGLSSPIRFGQRLRQNEIPACLWSPNCVSTCMEGSEYDSSDIWLKLLKWIKKWYLMQSVALGNHVMLNTGLMNHCL